MDVDPKRYFAEPKLDPRENDELCHPGPLAPRSFVMSELIRIRIDKVTFGRSKRIPGSGEVLYEATVDGFLFGHADKKHAAPGRRARRGVVHDLGWTRELDIGMRKNDVLIHLVCRDADPGDPKILAEVTERLKWPFAQTFNEVVRSGNGLILLQYDVELEANDSFGRHSASTIFASRQNINAVTMTTVSGAKKMVRMEFHPVCPNPSRGLPAVPRVMGRGRGRRKWKNRRRTAARIDHNSALNVISNPAVIPILDPSTVVLDKQAARIEYSRYWPKSMKFKDKDPRLEWSVQILDGSPSVKFVGGDKTGKRILVYGEGAGEGEVLLVCKFRGHEIASYRALVRKIKEVKCRFQILKNKDWRRRSPRSGVSDIKRHMAVANRTLYQAGIQLILDDDETVSDGAAKLERGFFEISVADKLTRGVGGARGNTASMLNERPEVMNFVYIHSRATGSLGTAWYFPASSAGLSIAESGTPSSSWKKKSGVQYKAAPPATTDTVTMKLLPATLPAGHTDVFTMLMTNASGHPRRRAQTYGNTMAHEFGHILNLWHRNPTRAGHRDDGVGYPKEENLMHYDNPATIAQDLDIIQVKAMHQSSIF